MIVNRDVCGEKVEVETHVQPVKGFRFFSIFSNAGKDKLSHLINHLLSTIKEGMPAVHYQTNLNLVYLQSNAKNIFRNTLSN